jgi:hypothetical protein
MMPAGCHCANMLAANTEAHLVSADLLGGLEMVQDLPDSQGGKLKCFKPSQRSRSSEAEENVTNYSTA